MPQWLVNVGTYLKDAALGVFGDIGAGRLTVRVAVVLALVGFCAGGIVCSPSSKTETVALGGMGWVDKPDYVKQQVSTFASPYFGDSGKNLVQAAKDEDAFLWKAYEKVTGKPWEPHDQNGTGCCVGEGNSGAVEILQGVESALGDPEEYRPISAAAMYALAREIGNDLGNQDGAVGADAAKALMQLGALSCEEAKDTNGRDDTAKSHAALAKKWGRTGLPHDLKALAKAHIVKTASLVRTPEEVRAALCNGYPVTICCSVGFEGHGGFKRDKDGFCYPGGTWPHCQFVAGYRADKKAFAVFQSWGASMPPGPKTLGQPDGTYWITWDAMQRVVKGGECFALSTFEGYKGRDLPLFIKGRERIERNFARLEFPKRGAPLVALAP